MSQEDLKKRYDKAAEVDGIQSEFLQQAFLFRVGDIDEKQLQAFVNALPNRVEKLFDVKKYYTGGKVPTLENSTLER